MSSMQVAACDALVDGLKSKVPGLSGIYERSDAMLAMYPGGGSRFARHIDNTTGDGRRLTLLVYLNPLWSRDLVIHDQAIRTSDRTFTTSNQGGALRQSTNPN